MDMATELAGMTKGQGYLLIKAVGKKIKSLLDEQKDKFIQACTHNHVPMDVAHRTWELIEPFARYGFNKAHSACYATIAYQTAYCKANFPAEFMAAVLTSDQHNSDRIALEIDDARKMGLQVLPPDVNESFASFTVVNDDQGQPRRIRFGLSAIKNVGEHLVETVIEQRKQAGPFASLDDFLRRVQHKDLNKKSLESLAKAGALDHLGERQALVENANELLRYARGADLEASTGQTTLFGSLPTRHSPQLRLKPAVAATGAQRGQWERELLGLYITDHPLTPHRALLERLAQPITSAREQRPKRVKLGGLLTKVKRITTRTNESMAFAQLEDLTGSIEVVVFPSVFRQTLSLWEEDQLVIIDGQGSNKDGEYKILVDRVRQLRPEMERPTPVKVQIQLSLETTSPAMFDELKQLLSSSPGDQLVELLVRKGAQQKLVPTSHHITLTPDLRSSLERLLGNCLVE